MTKRPLIALRPRFPDEPFRPARCSTAPGALASFDEQDEADWCARVLTDPDALAHNHP